MARRVTTAREQHEMLLPWRAASSFNPDEVTKRLRGEFDDWHDRQPVTFVSELGLSHWPNVESFLRDNYPAVHRGFTHGREQAGELLEDPDGDYRYNPQLSPYPVNQSTQQSLGYDPEEIAAGMLLLHNQYNGSSRWRETSDKERLNDIFNKRVEMQQDYEQRQ